VCAIGPATARQLATYGIRPDAQPPQHEGAAIVELLASRGELAGQRVLCPRPEHAAAALVEGLTARGAAVEQVVAYRTVPDNARMDVVRKDLLAGRIHWVTFTSASAATSFFKDIRPQELRGRVKLACIGPSTSNALRAMDLEPTVEARDHTAGGLADAILEAEGP
jgi:uroporphyrinogen III methyltransferase/synthase